MSNLESIVPRTLKSIEDKTRSRLKSTMVSTISQDEFTKYMSQTQDLSN